MGKLENMEAIEAAQTELGQYLVGMMPVPWKKICFYARCVPGFAQTWFGMIESETGVICARDFFWNRYDNYQMSERDTDIRLDTVELQRGQNQILFSL